MQEQSVLIMACCITRPNDETKPNESAIKCNETNQAFSKLGLFRKVSNYQSHDVPSPQYK